MTISLINPEGLPKVDVHHQVSLATGSKLVFMAGQVAWRADGALVGKGDLAAQVEQCFLNVGAAVAGAGGSFDNVAKLTIYIVDWTGDRMSFVREGRTRAFVTLGVNSLAPGTLIGVAALFAPDLLVEIEAIAVIDEGSASPYSTASIRPIRPVAASGTGTIPSGAPSSPPPAARPGPL